MKTVTHNDTCIESAVKGSCRHDAPAPQETPTQQGWFWLHGNLIDPEGRIALTVANGITTDDAHTILNALNRDPAFQKLVEALANMCDKFYPHQCKFHGPAICDRCEALRQASEALRLAREGEE